VMVKIVREIFQRFAGGESMKSIARDLQLRWNRRPSRARLPPPEEPESCMWSEERSHDGSMRHRGRVWRSFRGWYPTWSGGLGSHFGGTSP